MHRHIFILMALLALVSLALGAPGCGKKKPRKRIVVNTLEDLADPPKGTVSLRFALGKAKNRQPIVFDESLDGGTIALSLVAREHTMLVGEVMGIRDEESGPVSYLVGYFDRDYGRSALFSSRKNVIIDASALPSGITLEWTGGDANPARVLAVRGNLTLKNVAITGGRSFTQDISTGDPDDQPWTLARGGGLAVWGVARLEDCTLYDNHVRGDFDSSRDRGAFGGGVYADIVEMEGCVVSGNTVLGAGAAGGGVFSVGGAGKKNDTSWVEHSAITGNRISGIFTYGGGVYSDGGGIGNAKMLRLANNTIARNVVEPAPGLPPFLLGIGFWRGGGAYASNGDLMIDACTIVENQVHGLPRTDDLGKPNLAGGVAATIGNAHALEDVLIGQSIIAGNTVHEIGGEVYDHDVFTGSAFYFRSMGYNRIGVIDFSQILVPVGRPGWGSLSRKHYPKLGDQYGVELEDVVDTVSGIEYAPGMPSSGPDAPGPAVYSYAPFGNAVDQVPASVYAPRELLAEYSVEDGAEDDFLEIVLARIEAHYGLTDFAPDFSADFESFLQSVDTDESTPEIDPYTDPSGVPILTLADTRFFGPGETWPRVVANHPYIHFWHRLEQALADEGIPGMGPEGLADEAWEALFSPGPLAENPDITLWMSNRSRLEILPQESDQIWNPRPVNAFGDVGAIELP